MSDLTRLVLGGLASFRLARMLALEEGPGGVFDRVRGRCDPQQTTWLGRGLNCPLCVGFWTSLLMAVLLWDGSQRKLILNWWGMAGAQSLLHLWIEK